MVTDSEVAEDVTVPETTTVEEFDIVISHDNNLKRVFGVDINVENTTAEQIRANSKLSQVCFFDEYLKICKQCGMIPIIEIKDFNLTDEGIDRLAEMVNEKGLLEQAQFISFDATVLERTRKHIINTYSITPYTGYLYDGGNVSSAISLAKNKGFTGINLGLTSLTPTANSQCKNNGLKICTWTYRDNRYSDEMLYKHIISGGYNVYSTTTDGKFF